MYLTILGNNGPFPAPGGACSSYLLESDSGETKLLIDAGTGSLARLMDIARPETLDAVVLSHLHFDHMSDLLPMQYALQFSARERPLPRVPPPPPRARARAVGVPVLRSLRPRGHRRGRNAAALHPRRAPGGGFLRGRGGRRGQVRLYRETRTSTRRWSCSRMAATCCWPTPGFRAPTGRRKSRTSPLRTAGRWRATCARGRSCSHTSTRSTTRRRCSTKRAGITLPRSLPASGNVTGV